jgi:hypothetical protein
MTIAEIEQAITQLSSREFNLLRKWFEELEAKNWDEQIERDAKSGRLDPLLAKAMEEYSAGLSKPL